MIHPDYRLLTNFKKVDGEMEQQEILMLERIWVAKGPRFEE